MNGFVGEFLILLGAFSGQFDPAHARIYTAVAATGVILSAVYMLWMFQRVNYGPLTNDKNRGLRDLSVREWFVIAPICAMAIFMGVVPGVFLKPMEPAVAQDGRADRRREPRRRNAGAIAGARPRAGRHRAADRRRCTRRPPAPAPLTVAR